MADKTAAPHLVLVRHGETAYNRKAAGGGESAERIRGWKDVPLDAVGRTQAKDLAARIAKGHDVAAVWSSPLSRAYVTAEHIATACGTAQPQYDTALKPWHLGDYTGQKVSDVLPAMQRLATKSCDHEKAPGGESFRSFLDRFLGALINHLFMAGKARKTHLLVTHTRNIQAAKAWIAAGAHSDLDYDEDTMNDYSQETPTAGELVLEVET
jgi:probable phosphoglycerate mutase